MNYRFTEFRYNLDEDTVTVVVCFEVGRRKWKEKHYTFDAPEEIRVFELIDKTKELINDKKINI